MTATVTSGIPLTVLPRDATGLVMIQLTSSTGIVGSGDIALTITFGNLEQVLGVVSLWSNRTYGSNSPGTPGSPFISKPGNVVGLTLYQVGAGTSATVTAVVTGF